LEPCRRAEQAFVSVITDAYLAGVSTNRVERLVQQLGIERVSKRPRHAPTNNESSTSSSRLSGIA
jgi:transposase-like protein